MDTHPPLEKLAAVIPKPRINLLIYYGAFAPHARDRPGAVRRAQEGARHHAAATGTVPGADRPALGAAATATGGGAPPAAGVQAPAAAVLAPPAAPPAQPAPPSGGYTRPKHYAWAALFQRIFAIDILDCSDCGGRLRLVATIDQPEVIEKILRHLGLPVDAPLPTPARDPPWLAGALPGLDAESAPPDVWPH